MPSLNDLVNVAESLEKSPMALLQESCVSVRNRNAACRLCIDVCPHECIAVDSNKLTLKPLNCVNCGLCATVCPTEAIRPVKPTDIAAAHQLASAWHAANGHAVVACARVASKREADPTLFAEVPCLGYVHEALLLTSLSTGAHQVTVVDGDCSTCKYGFVNDLVNHVVDTANVLLAAQGAAPSIVRTHAFPPEFLADDTTGMYGSSRRTFFSDTVKSARDIAVSAADTALKQELGVSDETSIGDRLRVSEEGTLPQIAVPRHDALLNALFAIGEGVSDNVLPLALLSEAPESATTDFAPSDLASLDTRLFARIDIDSDHCIQCGMCAVFCPTQALRRPLGNSLEDRLEALEFSASDCVQCGLCVDVCWKKCITLDSRASLDEVFDFEPRVLPLLPQR